MAGGFMSGFGPAFGKTFSAGIDRAMDSYDDKVKTQMAYALEQKSAFEKAKSADEALVKKAEALAANVPGAPDEAWKVAYGQLKAGRDEEKILEEMRKGSWTAVETPETVDTPEASTEAPVEAQMQEVMGEPTSQPKAPEEAPAKPEEEEDKGIMDTLQGFRDKNKARVESNVNESVRSRLGVEQDQYDEWLTGYSSPVSSAMQGFKFTPPVATKDDKPPTDPKKYRFWMLTNSQEFKAADPATQDQMITSFEDSYEKDDSAISFGNSLTGGLMEYWMQTEEGQAAVADGNVSAIVAQATKFTEAVSKPSNTEDKPENISDMTSYLYNQWADTEAGKTAIANNDVQAIGAAWVSASTESDRLKELAKPATEFDPASVTELKMLPGLRAKYANNPVVLEQLSAIEAGLKDAVSATKTTEPGTDKPVTIYTTGPNGSTSAVTGIFNSKTGLTIGGKQVAPEDTVNMLIVSADQPIDAEKVNASAWNKAKEGVLAAGNLAETSLNYISTFEQFPMARTWSARTAASFDSLINTELPALGQVIQMATFKDPKDGTDKIDATKLQNLVLTTPEFSNMADGTRQLLAQELALPFILAKADGNSGTALSDKDYKNYYESIFNSKDINVIRANLERLTYEKVDPALRTAASMKDMPMAQYIVSSQWYADPRGYMLEGRHPAVAAFVEASYARRNEAYDKSSYAEPAPAANNAVVELRKRLEALKQGGAN